MLEHVYWIPLIPLLASVIILFGGKESPDSKMPLVGITAMGWCMLHSAYLFYAALTHRLVLPYSKAIPWFSFGEYEMSLGVLIDGPAVTLLFVVTLVSFLAQVYSLGYMHGDKRFKRYFAYMSFFTASMLGLVVSSNLLVVFACWELVGVSSYLLIGFWFEKPGPAYAGKKAFITTKLGDLGFMAGLLLLFAHTGTFDLSMLAYRAELGQEYLSLEVATITGLLFLCGAAGKSAQVPLFIWLPDAMEGPTPVSCLIHAATMVVAGIYLIARVYFIYAAAPLAMAAVAWMGLCTAFLAATMAITAYDIKRVLAFSTISQLGYMMMGMGVLGYTTGLFHLTTHAFFKGLLFLGAGSVIHAVHTNDMREMGGLSQKMPTTFLTMTAATLAIAGCPFLSGWYSKEAILHAAYVHNKGMWFVGLVTAGITTFYMFRLVFMTFLGNSRDHHRWEHAQESPAVMTVPLWILAVLSVGAGFLLNYNGVFEGLVQFDVPHGMAEEHHAPGWLGAAAVAVFLIGGGLAYKLYGSGEFSLARSLRERFSWAVETLEKRYYFDDFFLWLVSLADKLAAACAWVDDRIIDAIFIDGWALLTRTVAEIHAFFDDFFIDGAVDGLGTLTEDAGWGLRRLVRGYVQEYLLYIGLAVSIFAIFLMTR
ncbi:MAG: NADH-quinone oxidoreductase subunit L [Elusimicrobiota bacterium]